MKPSKKQFIIVEDHAVQAMMLTQYIEKLGHTVAAVVDRGENAITKTLELNPDMLIMDIFLNGDMNGIEAMREIRKKSEVPVIFVSGNSDPFYVQNAQKTEFSYFLHKPVRLHNLNETIEQAFGKINIGDQKSFFQKLSWPFNLFF